jgi:spore coat protein CotH
MVREKLLMDMLSAAGAVTFYGHFVRLYMNEKPYGLFLMTDDTFKGFTDNLMNNGSPRQDVGVTFKGNAINDQVEANLVYKGDDEGSYSQDAYSLEDPGNDPSVSKDSFMNPLIQFMKKLK